MARKRLWLSWLPDGGDVGDVRNLVVLLSKSGLEVDGTPLDRAIDKAGWIATADAISDADRADVWLVVGRAEDFHDSTVRYSLSLAYARAIARRSASFALLCAGLEARPEVDGLPSLLQDAECLAPPEATWGAKCVAGAIRAPTSTRRNEDFRFNVIAHASLGQWFEVGPVESAWRGALFGVSDGSITHHGVGPSGELPERCTLEYPSMGMRIDAGDREFTCCSVKNELAPGESYYIRVTGHPDQVLFGEESEQDEASVRILNLV